MLGRGNSDAATRLRRAKSISTVARSTPYIPNHDLVSTYDNAKTAATKAYEAAHGFIAESCTSAKAKRKSKSDGPGSHLARQRTNPRRVPPEDKRCPKRKSEPSYVSAEAAIEEYHWTTTAPTPDGKHQKMSAAVNDDSSVAETTNCLSETPTRPRNGSSTNQSKWELFNPLRSKPSRLSISRGSSSVPQYDGFEDAPLFANAEGHDGLEAKPYLDDPCSYVVESLEGSNFAKAPTPVAKAKQSLFFSKPRLRSKGSSREVGNARIVNDGEPTIKPPLIQRVQRIPSSISAVAEACKRRLGKTSRNPSAQVECPRQQIEPRRSHHFGSSRLSHRSAFTGFDGIHDAQSRARDLGDRPPTPPRHTWFAESRPVSAQGGVLGICDVNGTNADSSRIASWENTSGYSTVKFSDGTAGAETPTQQRRGTPIQRLHMRHQASYSSIPKLKIPRRKSSAHFKTPGLETQRIYSALIKRISDSDGDDDGDGRATDYLGDMSPEISSQIDQNAHLPSLAQNAQRPSTRGGRGTVRMVERQASLRPPSSTGRAPSSNGLPIRTTGVTSPAKSMLPARDVSSPSVYSPYPRSHPSAAMISSLSLNERGTNDAGTAVVSPSKPFTRYSLDDDRTDISLSQVVTSGEWREWAHHELSGLEPNAFRPPSIHIREATEQVGSPTPPMHGDQSLIHPAMRPGFSLNRYGDVNGHVHYQTARSQRNTSFNELHNNVRPEIPSNPCNGNSGTHHVQHTDDIQSRHITPSKLTLRRPSSSNALAAPHKVFSFTRRAVRRPSTGAIVDATISAALSPLREQTPSVGNPSPLREQTPSASNVRASFSRPYHEHAAPPAAKAGTHATPPWIPSLRGASSQPLRDASNGNAQVSTTAQAGEPAKKFAGMTDHFLKDIRKGPYAESTSSAATSARTTPSPAKMSQSPQNLNELRLRRTRRGRRSIGGLNGLAIETENEPPRGRKMGRDMVEGFLKDRQIVRDGSEVGGAFL